MRKKYTTTPEEFEAIQDAITNVLHLWQYEFIEANNGDEDSISMSTEPFFEALKKEFDIQD